MNSHKDFRLRIEQGPLTGREFKLTQPEVIIGRDKSLDLVFSSASVSRQHARLIRQGDNYLIEDLGSSNGTYINGERLSTDRKLLRFGDRIGLGKAITLLYFSQDWEKQPAVQEAISEPSRLAQTLMDVKSDLVSATRPPQIQVLVAGEKANTYPLNHSIITVGRAEDNDIVISSRIVSRHHARLESVNGGFQVVVLPEANNPLLYEGRPIQEPRRLKHLDTFRIGSLDPGLMVTMTYISPAEAVREQARQITFGEKTKIQIGRDRSNDVVLDTPTVSRFHAQVERVGQRYRLRDYRSSNGTFVNDERIQEEVWLKPTDTIRIGPYRFVVSEDRLAQYDDSGGLRVEAIGLNKWVRKDLNILQDISVIFQPREFIVIVGQSGGGKSTLVDAIAGYRPASHGHVYVNDIDVYKNFDAIRSEIGYVPQKDIIHMELTVSQALDYAAQLRMPSDTSKEERDARVMEVLQDLDLTHRKEVQISGLSGGQQKRVSIGVELLTKPGLFFLDEPTSGLDPGTETALMHLMRRLADQGRTIILITHATKNVMLADKVIFLARGGYLAWFGPPDEALNYFNQYRSERDQRASDIEFDDIYAILDDPSKGSPEQWANRFKADNAYQKYILQPIDKTGAPSEKPGQSASARKSRPIRRTVSTLRQFLILSKRNLKILTRDRFGLALMLATAPVVSLLDVVIALLLGRDPFNFESGSLPNVMITLFMLTLYGVMVGGLAQMREIVKEQEIYKRERLVNLKILPYVLSKIWVAALLALYQAMVYTIVHYLAFEMPGSVQDFVMVYITLVLATMAGMMLGLFSSALAPNANAAPLILIIFMLPQIVLGGALIPLPEFVSMPTSTRWAFEALMGITGVGSDVAGDVCWVLPEDLRNSMTLDDKLSNGCRCLGLNALKQESCNYPGLGKFYQAAIDEPPPTPPAKLGDPPPEPSLPDRPMEPTNQADNVAMADFFAKLKVWEQQVNQIQASYKHDLETYQSQADVYKVEAITYQEELANWQIGRASAVEPAERLINQFYKDFGWTFVNKRDRLTYYTNIGSTWVAQIAIMSILFLGILLLQKRKDIN